MPLMTFEEKMEQYHGISIAQREAESEALGIAAWDVPLWDGIHSWAANLTSKSLKRHTEALGRRVLRIPSMLDAVVLVNTVVERAVARERRKVCDEIHAALKLEKHSIPSVEVAAAIEAARRGRLS